MRRSALIIDDVDVFRKKTLQQGGSLEKEVRTLSVVLKINCMFNRNPSFVCFAKNIGCQLHIF